MWKTRLQEIAQEMNLYGEKINTGATEEEIQRFIRKTKDKFNVDLPDECVKILEVVNGLEFNGYVLYGVDQELLDKQQNQSITGLIELNEIWYENEWQKQYLFLGESNISWYVFDLAKQSYCELDNPSGREIKVFDNLDCLLEQFLSDALA